MTLKKVIVVNATALAAGGALTILKQFIEAVPEDGFEYLVFAPGSVDLQVKNLNLKIVKTGVTTYAERFLWDLYGLHNQLKKRHITPAATISLQNTGFRVGTRCPRFIYYHQSIPLYPYRWNPLKSGERILWFYKTIYPFFVRLFMNRETEVFVQLDFLKKAFATRFRIPGDRIHVVFPRIETTGTSECSGVVIDDRSLNLFYPAASYIYKNHSLLVRALSSVTDSNLSVTLYLTVSKDALSIPEMSPNIKVVFLGPLEREEVQWLYMKVDALLFPSYIETLGLPLIEAAAAGLPILVSDLPYAHEVLTDYFGAEYIDYKDHTKWTDAILRLQATKGTRFAAYQTVRRNSWEEFFRVIESRLQ